MDQYHHHHHQRHLNPEFVDSRYFALRPPPPPPPRPFPNDHTLFHRHPPPPSPHHRHLPPPPHPPLPPPPPHSLSHLPPPPIPCILHQAPPSPRPPPPSISSHKHHHLDQLNFVNSLPHHHHHHQQHRRQLPADDEGPDRFRLPPFASVPSNRGVVYDRRRDEDDRHRFSFPESPRVPPIDARPMPNNNGLDWDRHARVHRPVNLDRVSPPPITEVDDRFRRDLESPPRFREDLNVEHRLRLHPEKLRDRRDDRRIMGHVERDDRRIMGNVERDDRRIMGNMERGDRRIMDNVERDDRRIMGNLKRDDHLHEQYHPEVLLREFELNLGGNECVRRPMVDEVPIRGSRDDVMLDENVNVRRGGVQPPPRDVSCSPVKFRNRGIDVDDGFYEEGMNFGSELGRYADKGRREEMQDYSRILRKNSQKKSAFLRIHPLIHSSSRNRYETTPSPHKGKELLEPLDHRLSQERDRSPVELDVSFKSNALVAKAIMGNPSSSAVHHNKSSSVGDLNISNDSESPSKTESVRNCGNNSFLSRKEEKHSENRVRTSPIMKRVGRPSQVEARGSNSESVSSGSSSLSGGTSCRGSPKGQISLKGDTSVHPDKVSSLSVRKKRKSIISRSPLSGSVPTKTDVKLVNMDNSVNQPSDSCNSDKCMKNSEEELSSGGQVIRQIENEIIEDTGKVDVNESICHSVSEASFPKRIRKRGRLEFLPDSPIPTSESPENANRCANEEQRTSNSEKNVTKSVKKCSSKSFTEYGSSNDQDMMPVLVDNGFGEGTSESLASLGGNMNSIDIHHGNVDKHDPVALASSTSSPVDVSDIVQDRVDLTCTVDKVDKSCENQVILSTEKDTGEQLCENVHMGIDDNQAELRNSGDFANVVNFSNIDLYKTSAAFNEDVDTDKLITISDISATNDIQVQECQGASAIVVDEVRGESPKDIDSLGCDLTLFTVEPDISLLNRKRKAGSQLDSLDSEISESSLDSAVAGSIPVEKMSSAVSGSSCFITESDVLLGNELMDSRLDSISSMNHGCDSDRIEYYSSCSKKQKTYPFESVSSDALISDNGDLPASAGTLISMVEVPIDSVKYSTQSAERIGLFNSIVPDMNLVGEATNSLSTTNCSFSDSSKADLMCEHPCLYVKENTYPDIKQSSLSEAGCKQKEDVNLMTSEAGSGSGLIAFESEGRIATIHQNACGGCFSADLFSDSDHGLLVTNMACETNITVNGILPSVFDYPQLGAECTYDGVDTDSDILDSLPNAGSSQAGCLDTPMLDISDTVPAANVMSEEKQGMDDKRPSEHLVMQGSLFSHSNSHLESKEMNLKPGVSASAGDQPVAQKTILVPSKNAKNTVSSSNVMSGRLIRRNVLTRADASFSSGSASSVIASSKRAPSTYTAKPRTWHRTDNPPASNILVKKPFVGAPPPQRPPFDKTVKVQCTSYIRKGNSLVRHPASGAETLGPRVFGASINQSKPNDTNKFSRMGSSGVIDSTVVHDFVVTGGQNTPIEMPKTPPLPCSGKESNCDILNSGDCGSSPPVGQSVGMNNEEVLQIPGNVGDKNLEDTGSLSDGNLSASNSNRIVYIKRKSYQLIAAKNPPEPCAADKGPALSSDNSYYKRRKNQLIRASSESNIQQMVGVIDDGSNLQPQRAPDVYSGRSSAKRQSNRVKPPKVSLVWKLGDRKSSGKGDLLRCGKILSHLLPWKRATYWRSVWRSSASGSNSSSLMKRKSHSSRRRAMVYVRSGLGFSLRRSKVISIAGSSLKWSKSMEKHSKKVNEEAAAAVMDTVGQRTGASVGISGAESRNHSSHKPIHSLKQHPGERIFRIGVFRYRMDPSRRTLQRISDEEPSDSAASKPGKDARKPYVPKRLLIGSDEYVRIGNGNQLVRDPKRRTRVLASEKVRWSLHTARMRLAKKRKFCQFFTRFGKCNKGEGKCSFIHDPSKIAVCTKFLNGLCGDPNCKLTHKVIPERMPDCSFFLQGLCSNENCSYRHVNVNPKASICESFSRGYCAEGNECRKKHSYICPDFEATGSCPQGSRCKLYHPKKGKAQKHKILKDQKNARGRYFGSGLTVFAEPETAMAEKHVAPKNNHLSFQGGDLGDYMNIDVSDDEAEDHGGLMMIMSEPMIISEGDSLSCQLDDLDELIKPLRLLERN